MKNKSLEASECQMTLLRKLIYLAYTHADNGAFLCKFRECVHISSLKKSGVIKANDSIANTGLSEREADLYNLMQQGFTPQEIVVILGEKSVNAVYVKQHRLRNKLKGSTSPEIVLVMLIVCVIYLLGLFDIHMV